MMDIHPPGTEFKIGKSIVVKKGEDITIVATGETLQRAYLASELLKESNIHCSITVSYKHLTLPTIYSV